jgi:hypothetical protein
VREEENGTDEVCMRRLWGVRCGVEGHAGFDGQVAEDVEMRHLIGLGLGTNCVEIVLQSSTERRF